MLTENEIIEKANKCLNCKKPLCKEEGCPIGTSIPEFISKIKENNFEEAYHILQENNIMSEICSLVCPHENYCMGHCVRGIKGEPVCIPILEQNINLWAEENKIKHTYKKENANNIKIAVIGSGPAGIACSKELSIKGYDVTIFEREDKIGGTITYGIPDFRIKKDLLNDIEEKILKLGIKLKLNTEFGKDFNIEKLKEEGFKAIFIGIGANVCSTYKLCESQSSPIYKANEFLKAYYLHKNIGILNNVIVIGGGNVAIDAARAAKKMGAKKVTIVYRKNIEKMPARKIEIEEAIHDNVNIIDSTRVLEVIEEKGHIKAVKCIKTIIENDELIDVQNSEFLIETDSIIFAIGLKPEKELLEKEGIIMQNGYVEIDENGMTNLEGVFAGGDVSQTKPTVCLAIKAGKRAADGIEKYINK